MSTHALSYGRHSHVDDAPIGAVIASRRTSGRGRRKSWSSDRLSRFTRTSLYSQSVPGGRMGRGTPLSVWPKSALPRSRLWSIESGLPNSVPEVVRDRVVEPLRIEPRLGGLRRGPVPRRRDTHGRPPRGAHARAAAIPVAQATPVPPWPQ